MAKMESLPSGRVVSGKTRAKARDYGLFNDGEDVILAFGPGGERQDPGLQPGITARDYVEGTLKISPTT